MRKILLPVDGSLGAEHAVQYVIELVKDGAPLDVHLMNVQPPIESAYLRRFVTHQMVDEFQRAEAEKAFEAPAALLDHARVRYDRIIEVGSAGEAIAQRAESGFDSIVMGSRGRSGVGNLVLGSVAARVVHLAPVPVTLVR